MSAVPDEVREFEAARPRLFALAYRLLGSASEAEDAVQDTFLRWNSVDRAAVGDTAAVPERDGKELRMACAPAIPIGRHAADAIASRLRGRSAASFRFRYLLQCLSLGRRDGVIQFVHADDSPRNGVLTGRAAALLKETIVRGAARAVF